MIEVSENQNIRFTRASLMIPSDVKAILDVGCGQGNFLMDFVKTPIRKFAVDKDYSSLLHIHNPKSLASINALPFVEKAVDIVVCMEVIEHLPHGLYELALRELSRVANKYILITVPYNQKLQEMLVQCPLCYSRFNPYLHVRSFDDAKISQLFSIFGWVCKEIKLIRKKNVYIYPLKNIYKSITFKDMPANMKCPICDYFRPTERTTHNIYSVDNVSMINKMKNIFLKIVPKKVGYSWIAGLYERKM